jgi:hypothetical protein
LPDESGLVNETNAVADSTVTATVPVLVSVINSPDNGESHPEGMAATPAPVNSSDEKRL